MGSFKLEKGTSSKQEATNGGAVLIVLGIAISFLWYPVVGGLFIILGLILLIGGKFATS